MPINSESFHKDLYDTLKVRYKPTPINSKGQAVPVPQEADIFKFDFTKDGENYGSVWATIDNGKQLVLYYDDEVENSPDDNTSGTPYSDSWTALKQQLKKWSKDRMLGFELRNRDHLSGDMAQRSHMKEKEQISEGYFAMGKKSSYSDNIPQVKIILQHTRQLEEGEQRFRNVDKIFVENVNGERFLIPTKRPGLARVYARHIAEGGTPYDERGKHITSLVEEFSSMAGFVRATKNTQFNESAQKLVTEGVNHYNNLRETLTRMTSHRGYNKYFDAYTPVLNEESDDATSLNELFVQETLDPRIESVMPILKRLQKNISEMAGIKELDEWAEELVNEKLDTTTKTLAEPAVDMLDEAPGAMSLKHNQNTEKSNLKAFDLAEDDMEETVKPSAKMMKKIKKKFHKIEEKDLTEESKVYFVTQKGTNKAVGTWDGAVFKPFDRSKYPAGTMDMVPKDCEIDKTSGPVDKSQRDMEKAVHEAEVDEGLDANQKRAGQLGPTEPVGKNEKNLRGKLVGANEDTQLEDELLEAIKKLVQ